MAAQFEPGKLRREARIFGVLASVAITITLICVLAQIATAAAPLWRGGNGRQALLNVGVQAILAAPALFYIYGLHRARSVFRRFSRGEMFALVNSQGLVAVGAALLAGALWAIAAAGLEPAGSGPIAENLSQIGAAASEIALAALGLALVMIGRVLAAAARLKADNDSIV